MNKNPTYSLIAIWKTQVNSLSYSHYFYICCSCTKLCLTLCDPMDCSMPSTVSLSLLKFMSIESVMPSSHLILYCPLLLLPSIFLSIRVFSNESILCICKPGREPSPRNGNARALSLDFPASRTVESKFVIQTTNLWLFSFCSLRTLIQEWRCVRV